ncbi:MAG: YkgJ family cysteine cluster protein [Chlamydiia bacterium]|nr:YkgJ family cysteine cluster protein [Chlamydiia bacterium]
MSLKIWYEEGLHFECTGCGKCCTGAPGYTWVSESEIRALAENLKISVEEFGRKYLRKKGNRYALLEKPVSYDCIFLQEGKCAVYEARPLQCRTYPWWAANLKSKEAWQRAAKECEGIRLEAPKVSKETIEIERLKQEAYDNENCP